MTAILELSDNLPVLFRRGDEPRQHLSGPDIDRVLVDLGRARGTGQAQTHVSPASGDAGDLPGVGGLGQVYGLSSVLTFNTVDFGR